MVVRAFPSHIGSRSTQKTRSPNSSQNCFHPTLVLAQLFHLFGAITVSTRFHPTLVLAQLTAFRRVFFESGRFHPTLVLAQPARFARAFGVPYKFPSHIGSRSTSRRPDEEGYLQTFPSHIGSRSTWWNTRYTTTAQTVSIPHWFSLNAAQRNFDR